MLEIPTLAVPNQTLTVSLAGQPTRLNIRTQGAALYLDLLVNDALLLGGVVCENAVRMVRDTYLGFAGDLAWLDLQGSDDPVYTGLGTRWVLFYLTAAEAAALGDK